MGRYDIANQIAALDPVTDHQKIVFLGGAYENPYIVQRALEFALFRTFAVPSIARLLDETGEFEKRGQKRYDDTGLIIGEISEYGYDSERGRAAIRRMNQQHRRFDIANADYLYVLSTFIFEPIRWVERFGWRPITDKEKQSAFYFWREVGKRMAIDDIPETFEAFEQYNIAYERDHFHYTDANYRVGEATVQIFLHWYAAPLRPLVRRGIYALMDEPLLRAFGFPDAHPLIRALAVGGLKLRAKIMRYLPPRRKPYQFTEVKNRTYPDGYIVEKLGPEIE